jgi:heat-inducible transcriptional repressor
MRALEEEGFLTHPHTSAGRIPTEVGYRHYVENIMNKSDVEVKIKNKIKDLIEIGKGDRVIKDIAKYLAELTNNAVIVSFGSGSIFYTGVSNLFSQPEFRDYAQVATFSTMFDQVDDRLEDIYDLVDSEVKILIGRGNPLGSACSMVATKFGEDNLIALLGPMRMDYNKNFALINYLQKLF